MFWGGSLGIYRSWGYRSLEFLFGRRHFQLRKRFKCAVLVIVGAFKHDLEQQFCMEISPGRMNSKIDLLPDLLEVFFKAKLNPANNYEEGLCRVDMGVIEGFE